MFLRFDEVSSMMLLLCLCRRCCGAVCVDCERRRREQGGRESKEEVKFSAGAENYLTSHPLFTFVYTPSTRVSIYSLRALMKPPINPLLPTYFSDLADLSHHISPIYSTSLLITSLIPLPISQLPQKQK